MNDLNNEHNEDKWSDRKSFAFFKRYAFLLFWLVLAVVVAVYIIFNGKSIVDAFNYIFSILQPIVFGLVIAYLLNPSVKFYEKYIFAPLTANMKNQAKARGLNRGLSIALSVFLFIALIVILLNMIIPELYNSIVSLVNIVPGQLSKLTAWGHEFLSSQDTLTAYLQIGIDNITEYFQKWLQTELLSTVNATVSSLTLGVFEFLKTFFNFFVGIVISIYVLASKESFLGQAKKMFFSLFKPEKANIALKTLRKSNEIFIGFLTGKIIESFILGVFCFIGCTILQIPYTLLVSVIVGVTFLIPFFGPYLGAIPSMLIIFLADPVKGITFTIFIVVLQQIQCNLISPKILGNSTGLSPFWVVFSILLGGGLFGFVGLLIGVPAFAVIYYVIGQIVNHRLRKKSLPTESEKYVDLKYIDKDTGDAQYYTPDNKPGKGIFSGIIKKKNSNSVDNSSESTESTESKDDQ